MYMTHKRRLLAGILLSAALLSGCTSNRPPRRERQRRSRGLCPGGEQFRPGGLSAGRREQRRRKRSGGWVPGAGGIRER